MKFEESVTHPGLFQHETRDILLCVHVDDLLSTGLRDDLMWPKKQLFKKYELETLLMGDDDDMVKKAVHLGKTLEWGENAACGRIEDTRVHCCDNCRSISTPLCATVEKEGDRSDRPEVSAELNTKHRAAVARVVYLAQDRLDLGVAAVELAKAMAIPREGDDERFKRVARYLHSHPDHLQWDPFQEDTDTVVLTTDADWATCKESRRSNSGATLQLENHLIAAWSRVQPRIALTTREEELYAGTRRISETLRVRSSDA